MRKGLKALAVQTYGFSLNRQDFAKMPLPAIMLSGQHYLLILSVGADKADIYDPTVGHQDTMPLPPLDNPKFKAMVLLTALPEVGR